MNNDKSYDITHIIYIFLLFLIVGIILFLVAFFIGRTDRCTREKYNNNETYLCKSCLPMMYIGLGFISFGFFALRSTFSYILL